MFRVTVVVVERVRHEPLNVTSINDEVDIIYFEKIEILVFTEGLHSPYRIIHVQFFTLVI